QLQSGRLYLSPPTGYNHSMNSEKWENSRENIEHIKVTPPPVELLLNPDQASAAWPANITRNKDFIEQTEQRRKLIDRLDTVLSKLPRPDMPLNEAVAQ